MVTKLDLVFIRLFVTEQCVFQNLKHLWLVVTKKRLLTPGNLLLSNFWKFFYDSNGCREMSCFHTGYLMMLAQSAADIGAY